MYEIELQPDNSPRTIEHQQAKNLLFYKLVNVHVANFFIATLFTYYIKADDSCPQKGWPFDTGAL